MVSVHTMQLSKAPLTSVISFGNIVCSFISDLSCILTKHIIIMLHREQCKPLILKVHGDAFHWIWLRFVSFFLFNPVPLRSEFDFPWDQLVSILLSTLDVTAWFFVVSQRTCTLNVISFFLHFSHGVQVALEHKLQLQSWSMRSYMKKDATQDSLFLLQVTLAQLGYVCIHSLYRLLGLLWCFTYSIS